MPPQPITTIPLSVVIHERLGQWSRQLRPRLANWPIHWVESRSSDDLKKSLCGALSPLLLIDLGHRDWHRQGIEDLSQAAMTSPEALILVLAPLPLPGLASLARECGATLVLQGFTPPPKVASLFERWLPLARKRGEILSRHFLERSDSNDWTSSEPKLPGH